MQDDFISADIDDLLKQKPENVATEEERTYQALLDEDRTLINGFGSNRERLRWPEPVRKRYLR